MTSRLLVAAALLGVFSLAAQAETRRTGLLPSALVEDVKSATATVGFMDYVANGQLIELQPQDTLVLSYLRSCEHETITGGTVKVGADRSDVKGGTIVRGKVPCAGGRMQLSSQQANASGASGFRLQWTDIRLTLNAQTPVIELPRIMPPDRTLVIERIDRKGKGQHQQVVIGPQVVGGTLFDLGKTSVGPLVPGAIYSAGIGDHKLAFRVTKKAKAGGTPVVSRLLRFPG